MMSSRFTRLGEADTEWAIELFELMAEVFEEPSTTLEKDYVAALLATPSFWAYAVIDDGMVLGGLTAHVLPMTRSMDNELMIYDLAIATKRQRTGLGSQLLQTVINDASSAGIATVFVPAEMADAHALDFYKAQGGSPTQCVIFTFERGAEDLPTL